MTANIVRAAESGTVGFIPLNKLKKSPKNARKTPHSAAEVEALAASISAKGLLQNLVVEPEKNAAGKTTGKYLVTIGEGRRLAQLLRVKRKQIKKNEPIRCVLDTEHDAHEISLAENVIRAPMHPADQFEAFKQLAEERGMSAEDIAARFGITPHVVRQRLRLGAVSPKLMQIYRDGGLSLEQLMAFCITEDHARQEQVYDNLSYNKEASIIRRMLTEAHVSARDRRARFVGPEAYEQAGGVIVRDLFSEDNGGYYGDAALLDRLVLEKLQAIAADVLSEGWKWAEAHIDFPHSNGMRRVYPHSVPLSAEDQEQLDALQAEFDALSAEYENAEELPDDLDAKFGVLEGEIERLSEQQEAYDPKDMARAGVFVVLAYDGTARLEHGFVRPEDDQKAEAGPAEPESAADQQEGLGAAMDEATGDAGDERGDGSKPVSDALVRDLTAHKTLGLRVRLGENPDIALIALTHALVAQVFYPHCGPVLCLGIKVEQASLASQAEGIEDTKPAKVLADRHANWARQLPEDVSALWSFVLSLDHDSRMALFAHCVSLTVNALRLPWEKRPRAWANSEEIAESLNLDMTAFWTPTARSYFGRIPKALILEAVTEAVSADAASRVESMKKKPMAEAAEQLLVGTGWLPPLLRTAPQACATKDLEAVQPQQVAAE